MNGLQIVGTIAGASVSLWVGSYLVQSMYDRVYDRVRKWQRDKIDLRHRQIVILRPDERGRAGIAYDGRMYRDLDSRAAYTQEMNVYFEPILEQLNAQHKMLTALANAQLPSHVHYEHKVGDQVVPAAGELVAPGAVELISKPLDRLLAEHRFTPRLHNVLIGEHVDAETGRAEPLTLDLPKAVHVLCTGASGLGKSTLLEAIALQIAPLEGVQLCAVDYGSGTFDALEGYMRWAIADTPGLAVTLFQELVKLANERKQAYKGVGRVRSLEQYNAVSGESLPFVACFVDETSALLDHKGTKGALIELARMGRKYGIGLILGGTDFKADTLPSQARGNCQARIAFWLESGLSRSLLDSNAANKLSGEVGEIVVKKPGQGGAIEGHTPMVGEGDYARLPKPRGRTEALQAAEAAPTSSPTLGSGDEDLARRVVELHAQGLSLSAIQRAVFGYTGGAAYDQVKAILDSTTTTRDGDPDDVDRDVETEGSSSNDEGV